MKGTFDNDTPITFRIKNSKPEKRGKTYNRTFSQEKWAQVNPENKAILEDFLLDLRSRKRSPRTITGYEQDIKIILCHILDSMNNISLLEMKKKDFRAISLWLSEGMGGGDKDSKGRSSARCNRMHSAMNSMMQYVCDNEDEYGIEVNQSKRVPGLPNERVKDDEDDFFFSYDEWKEVRQRLIDMGEIQIALFWSLAFDSGARKGEMLQIEKACFYEDGNHWTNIVRGKRGKKFPLFYMNDTRELALQWLEKRGEDDIPELFVYHGLPASGQTAYTWVLKCSKILSEIRGEPCNIFPHSIRHSRAECLSRGEDDRLKDENGKNRVYDLNEIRIFLHHDSVDVTQGYLKSRDEEILNNMFNVT